MASGLTRGDRMPDFRRLDHQDELRNLYDLQCGQAMTLLVFDAADALDTRTALAALSVDSSDWARITRVALVRGTPADCRLLVTEKSNGLTILADDGAVATHLLGPSVAGLRRITAFVLDSNLRVIERLGYEADGDITGFLKRVAATQEREASHTADPIRRQAPVLFIPRVMTEEFCDELIARFELDGGQPSGVAHLEGDKALWRPDPSVKMRRDVYVKEGDWLERIRDPLTRRVLPEIKRCFNFQVTQHEIFKLVCYDAKTGGYFRPHRDNESRDTQHRRFALTLNLNTGSYTGGQLRFPEFGPDCYEPERGGAIVFSSSLLHEVTPVTVGRRYVLLGFFFGETEHMAAIQYQDATTDPAPS